MRIELKTESDWIEKRERNVEYVTGWKWVRKRKGRKKGIWECELKRKGKRRIENNKQVMNLKRGDTCAYICMCICTCLCTCLYCTFMSIGTMIACRGDSQNGQRPPQCSVRTTEKKKEKKRREEGERRGKERRVRKTWGRIEEGKKVRGRKGGREGVKKIGAENMEQNKLLMRRTYRLHQKKERDRIVNRVDNG